MVSRFQSPSRRTGARALLAAVFCLCVAPPCSAVGSLLASEGDAAAALEVRFASAPSGAQTTRWVSVRVRAASRRVAWILPITPGVAVDPVNDAWLDALEQATAPRILAPAGVSTTCGGPAFENTARLPLDSVPPSRVAVLTSLAALERFVADHGFALPSSQRAQLAATSGAEYLALVYAPSLSDFWTETLRIQSAPGSTFTGLAASDEPTVLTLFSFGDGRARFASVTESSAPELSATWLSARSRSDYLDRRDAYLRDAGAFLLEGSDSRALYEARSIGAGLTSAPSVPSLVAAYFERARRVRLSPEATRTCEANVAASRERGQRGAVVGLACAPGVLAPRAASEPCVEAARAGEISAGALRCGAADDLAFALSGLNPSHVRLTRHVTRTGGASSNDITPAFVPGAEVPPLWIATAWDGSTCGAAAGSGAGAYAGAPISGDDGSHSGFGGRDGDSPEPDASVASDGETCASAVDLTCSSEEPGYAAEGDESCTSDSPGSSEDEGCSGDDESSGYDGETCSDDSSPEDSGYDGETCSEHSSSEDDSCAVRRPTRVRPRLSVLMMLLAAVLLPLRRWSRRRRHDLSAFNRL